MHIPISRTFLVGAAVAAIAAVPAIPAAKAQADFYAGKQITLVVGYEAGNDYDIGARLLARHLPKHIAGHPMIIVQNMPGASGVASANFLYARAPRDGLTMGSISRNLASQAVLRLPNIQADPRRYNWLGATSFPARICVASSSAPARTLDDVFVKELILGSVGAGSSTSIVPTIINHVLGTKFRLIEGYRGAQAIILAVERGEVQGLCASLGQFRSHAELFRTGALRILFRAEESPLPNYPSVPSIYDKATTNEQCQLMRFVFSSTEFGRPYLFPPGVPKDRVALLRKAIAETVKDPDLIADAAKSKLDMTYRPPEHLEQLVSHLYETPPELIATVKKISPNLR
jgi:tripartite-type tricarboxylate transporter receptor subunit TctC